MIIVKDSGRHNDENISDIYNQDSSSSRGHAMWEQLWYHHYPCFFFQVVIILLKEAHRTKGILEGVKMGVNLYPDNILIIIILGFIKGKTHSEWMNESMSKWTPHF